MCFGSIGSQVRILSSRKYFLLSIILCAIYAQRDVCNICPKGPRCLWGLPPTPKALWPQYITLRGPFFLALSRIGEADLMAYPWVISPPGAPTRAYFESMFPPAARERLPGLIETSSLIVVRGALLRSDRLTLISEHQIVTEQSLGLLAALPVATPGSHRRIGLTIRRGWRPTATHELLMEHIRAACAELAPAVSAPAARKTRSPLAPASRS